MVEGNRKLNQPLQELFLFCGGRTPHVFQNFVGFKKMPVVEKRYSTSEIVGRHALFCHRKPVRKQNLAPQREVWEYKREFICQESHSAMRSP